MNLETYSKRIQVNFFLKADLQTKEFPLKLSQKSEIKILGYHRAGLFLFESEIPVGLTE